MEIETQFSPLLVGLSVAVAIFASYVALNLAHSVHRSEGRSRLIWLACGALAMGIGIWSMHFIGMLAFEMPGMTMAYDIPLMVLSVVVAVGASTLALFIISKPQVPVAALTSGGVAMAAAIAGMHYIGMYSMRMSATIEWNLYLVALSIAIALVASLSALWILARLRNKTDHQLEMWVASFAMGIGIAGMHYVGMVAATFSHSAHEEIDSSHLLVSSGLTVTVVSATAVILILALASSVLQRLWEMRSSEANQNLVKSEEKFRRLIEAVKDYAIFMIDPDGRISTWNLGAERIYGYSEEEVMGQHVSIFYRGKDLTNKTADFELQEALRHGHFESEGKRIRKDGSEYWASVVIVPLFDRGKLSGFSKVTRDITEVKENERRLIQSNEMLEKHVMLRTRELQQSEKQLRNIADAMPVLIAQLSSDEVFLFANEAFSNWFGCDREDVVGKTLEELLGDDRYLANHHHLERALQGEMVTYERLSKGAHATAILSMTLVPDRDLGGQVTGVIVVGTDITKHKEIEAELKAAKDAAEEANATKSAFLANMSHEIRTPLGAVLGFSELLLDSHVAPEERSSAVEVIKRNGLVLSNIINDILDLSKVEAGKLEIDVSEFSFGDFVREMSALLGREAAAKGIELNIRWEGETPRQLRTDALRLRQILLNIVGNAIKFTNQGNVEVTIAMSEMDEAGKLAFIIKDTGEGIRLDQVARLFTPFTQADPSTTRKFGGTGLGLVLSKKLAQALGGDVVLKNTEVGRGSTFIVTIDPNLAPGEGKTDDKPITKLKRKLSLSSRRILLVEDSLDNQTLIKAILNRAGAAVETANNGQEGVEKAISGNFSVILMDLQMPIMDGYQATKLLRERGFKKPIVALTAHAMKEERQRSLRSGFNDHITKPIDQTALVKALAEYPV